MPDSPRMPSSTTSTPASSRVVRTTASPFDTPRRRRASNAGTTVTVSSMASRMLLSTSRGFPNAGRDDDEGRRADQEAVVAVEAILESEGADHGDTLPLPGVGVKARPGESAVALGQNERARIPGHLRHRARSWRRPRRTVGGTSPDRPRKPRASFATTRLHRQNPMTARRLRTAQQPQHRVRGIVSTTCPPEGVCSGKAGKRGEAAFASSVSRASTLPGGVP